MAPRRVIIAGGPRVGKTTLAAHLGAEFGLAVRHTDDLIGEHDWSAASEQASRWLSEPGPWLIEGVAVARALRKWLAAHPTGMPADLIYLGSQPRVQLTRGQMAMSKGTSTVWAEIAPALRERGVPIVAF